MYGDSSGRDGHAACGMHTQNLFFLNFFFKTHTQNLRGEQEQDLGKYLGLLANVVDAERADWASRATHGQTCSDPPNPPHRLHGSKIVRPEPS